MKKNKVRVPIAFNPKQMLYHMSLLELKQHLLDTEEEISRVENGLSHIREYVANAVRLNPEKDLEFFYGKLNKHLSKKGISVPKGIKLKLISEAVNKNA